ncbi:hypothetical protein MMC11_001988 [Xylographa trunciseda]|nr:hypothetical protein [Xylographa trunciseda]
MPRIQANPLPAQPPHVPDPTNPQDITTWSPSRPAYCRGNPHPILGCLDPPGSWSEAPITNLIGDDGEPIMDRGNQPIKDFPEWPRYISSSISGHDMEVLFRSSRHVAYRDIWARQPCWVEQPEAKVFNRFNQRRMRDGREPCGAICWSQRYSTRSAPKVLVAAVEVLTAAQIRYNTNFEVLEDGIVFKDGGEVLPLDYYLDGGGLHVPSKMVLDTLIMIHQLACLTWKQGLEHWTFLPAEFLPADWTKRGNQRGQDTASDAGLVSQDLVVPSTTRGQKKPDKTDQKELSKNTFINAYKKIMGRDAAEKHEIARETEIHDFVYGSDPELELMYDDEAPVAPDPLLNAEPEDEASVASESLVEAEHEDEASVAYDSELDAEYEGFEEDETAAPTYADYDMNEENDRSFGPSDDEEEDAMEIDTSVAAILHGQSYHADLDNQMF